MTSQSRRAFVASGLALAAGSALAPASALAYAAGKTVECGKVFPFYENYLKLPAAERSLFSPVYYLKVDGKPARGVKATMAGQPVPIGADGRMLRPPTLAQIKAKTPITFDAPADTKFSMTMQVEATLRPAAELNAADVAAALVQAAKGSKKAAGVMGMAVPKMERMTFKGVPSGTILFADGKSAALPAEKGSAYFDYLKHKGATRLKFPKAPSALLIGPAGK